jgi:hypothetical protein
MAVRISELNALSVDLSQADELPIVDISAAETKKITVANILNYGISGSPSNFIDLSKLNQASITKLSNNVLGDTGVASGTYGDASTVAQFVVNSKGVITAATGVTIQINASGITGLAPVATSGTYASLSGLPTLGTLSSQDANSVAISGGTISGVTFIASDVTISGGTISGITDLAIADGGTGASTASGARSNLGLAIGTDVQAYSSVLDQAVGAFDASNVLIYSSASGVVSTSTVGTVGLEVISGSTASGIRSTIGLGSIATQDAGSVVISGGTISGVTIVSSGVDITGGTISGITDLAIEDGGTGASDAATARTNLGLAIGGDVQAYSLVLSGIAEQFTAADEIIYASASGVVASSPFTSLARSIVSGATAGDVRTTLELGSIATQDAGSVVISGGTISGVTFESSSVDISGGTISGITDLAIEDGGTGASSAEDARTNLGLAIGTNVQAYSPVLSGVAELYTATDEIVYASASGVLTTTTLSSFGRSIASGADADAVRTTLGLGSMAVQAANSVVISGGTISNITDLAIADGGTGASSAADARTNLGLAIGSDVQAYDAGLASIAGLATAADQLLYLTGEDTYATSPLVEFSRGLLASGNSASDVRTLLELGALATKAIVSSGEIDSGVIVGSMVASGALIAANYGAGSVTTVAISGSAITSEKINDDAVTAAKLADNSSVIIDTGAPIATGAFIGQQYIDDANYFLYIWDGSAWTRQASLDNVSFVDSSPLAFSVAYPDANSAVVTTTVDNQAVNTIWAGPASGVDAAPTFRNLVAQDLPLATNSAVGAVLPGAGLSVGGNGQLNHSNSTTPGIYTGAITIDSQGHIVSAETALEAADIPDLDASKITTGQFSSTFLADNSVTASQLADYGIAQVSASAPVPEFAGQWWVNPNDRSAYIWVGEVAPTPNGYWLNLGYGSPTQINLRFGGTYNASGNTVESINSYGIEAGLTVGQALSAPNTSNNGVYLIVTASGVGTSPAPAVPLSVGNWVLSQGVGSLWTQVDLGSAVAGVADQDVLVDGSALVPVASGVASQEDFNVAVWPRVQIATSGTTGIVRGSSEILIASGTGIMSIGISDEGFYS